MEIIENKGYERLTEVFGPLGLIPHLRLLLSSRDCNQRRWDHIICD
jgi:hypothetical protein